MNEQSAIQRLRAVKLVARLLMLIGLGLFLFSFYALTIFGLKGFFFALAGVAVMIIGRIIDLKTRKMFANDIFAPIVQSIFPNSNFVSVMKDHSIAKDFAAIGMLCRDRDEKITNFLTIEDNGRRLCEFSIDESHTDTDSDGDSTSVTTFAGTLMRYNYATGIDGVVRILASHKGKIIRLESSFLPKKCAFTPSKIETGDIALDDSFEIYASDQHLGFYVLNATVIEKLKAFRAKYGDYGIAITRDELYIAFYGKDRFIHVPTKLSQMNEGMFTQAKNEIYELLNVLNEIGYTISKHVEKENIF